jgi:hypothetical protein
MRTAAYAIALLAVIVWGLSAIGSIGESIAERTVYWHDIVGVAFFVLSLIGPARLIDRRKHLAAILAAIVLIVAWAAFFAAFALSQL